METARQKPRARTAVTRAQGGGQGHAKKNGATGTAPRRHWVETTEGTQGQERTTPGPEKQGSFSRSQGQARVIQQFFWRPGGSLVLRFRRQKTKTSPSWVEQRKKL